MIIMVIWNQETRRQTLRTRSRSADAGDLQGVRGWEMMLLGLHIKCE